MAGFDPSVISSIPDSFDPVGSVQRAYTLKGLADEAQLNRLRLNQVRQDQTDQARLRDILKTSSYSNPDGVMKTAEKITQAGMPEEAMKFMQTAQSYQAGEVERQVNQLKLADAQQDAIAGTLDNVYGQLEQMRARGATPAMLDAAAAKLVIPAMQNLEQQNPQVLPVVQKFAQNPANLTYNGIRSAEAASNRGQQMIKSRLAELSENTRERQESERERHDMAMESNARAKEADKSKGGFSEDEGALMAALAERGVSLPTGFRSKEQQKALYAGILARNPTKSPDDIADLIAKGQIEFGSEKKATSTAAGVAGRTATAENEIIDTAPVLLRASDAVARGKFVPVNKLLQMKDSSLSDPNLKTLKVYINSMLNAYDQLAARGGTDKNKREEAHSLLLSAESPEALRAGVEAFKQEAAIAKGAAERAAGLPSSGTPGRGGGAGNIPSTNAQGWKLMQDAQGNRAYVSPDGKQFQQVQ